MKNTLPYISIFFWIIAIILFFQAISGHDSMERMFEIRQVLQQLPSADVDTNIWLEEQLDQLFSTWDSKSKNKINIPYFELSFINFFFSVILAIIYLKKHFCPLNFCILYLFLVIIYTYILSTNYIVYD